MSRRAIQAINWSAIAERLPESEKNVFAAFKAKSDQFLRRMAANPEKMPNIDWAYYKKTIATPGLVDKFQKEYDALKIPYPTDKYTNTIDAEQESANALMKDFIKEADDLIATYRVEVDKINNLLPYAEMTMEDLAIMYPEQAFSHERPTLWPHHPDIQPDESDKGKKQ